MNFLASLSRIFFSSFVVTRADDYQSHLIYTSYKTMSFQASAHKLKVSFVILSQYPSQSRLFRLLVKVMASFDFEIEKLDLKLENCFIVAKACIQISRIIKRNIVNSLFLLHGKKNQQRQLVQSKKFQFSWRKFQFSLFL